MVRTVHFQDKHYLEYAVKAAKGQFAIGLILGQSASSRESVIRLVRTPKEKCTDSVSNELFHSDQAKCLSAVSEACIADHAKRVTRMLLGGMYVLGIFIISSEDVFENWNLVSKIKSILNCMHKTLGSNQYMYGNSTFTNEKLVLHTSPSTKVLFCKSIEVGDSKNIVLKPVDWRFVPKPHQWIRLDCYYEFDDVYPLVVKKSDISVKQQFQQILESTQKTIDASVIFVDGELKDGSETLSEHQIKKKKPPTVETFKQFCLPKTLYVSIFAPLENNMPETVEYLECDGSTHFSGVVYSSVFMYPRATVAEAIVAVKQDIIRSLASRFTMYCDALIDDNLVPKGKVCFNEPPRRVLIPCLGYAYVCGYLFPGESRAKVTLSVRELLDVVISKADMVCDLETPTDKSEFDALNNDGSEKLLGLQT